MEAALIFLVSSIFWGGAMYLGARLRFWHLRKRGIPRYEGWQGTRPYEISAAIVLVLGILQWLGTGAEIPSLLHWPTGAVLLGVLVWRVLVLWAGIFLAVRHDPPSRDVAAIEAPPQEAAASAAGPAAHGRESGQSQPEQPGGTLQREGGINRRQLIALWAGIAAVVLMGLFPPWVKTYTQPGMHPSRYPAGYRFITAPPHGGGYMGVEVDLVRLLIEWGIVLAVIGALVVTLRRKPAS
jgi:hypothetical protein